MFSSISSNERSPSPSISHCSTISGHEPLHPSENISTSMQSVHFISSMLLMSPAFWYFARMHISLETPQPLDQDSISPEAPSGLAHCPFMLRAVSSTPSRMVGTLQSASSKNACDRTPSSHANILYPASRFVIPEN